MKSYYLFTQLGFAAVTLVGYAILIAMLRAALNQAAFSAARKQQLLRNTVLALVVWLVATGMLAYAGVLGNFDAFPPRLIVVLLIPLIATIVVVRTATVKALLQHVPPQYLLYLQAFRIPVEILIWMLFVDNLAPVQMTFEGRNLDVLSGITGPLVGVLYARGLVGRGVVVAWNFVGLALLINIVAVAILSMPTPMRVFMNEPANTIVAAFPVVWLPAMLVPLAYGLHFLSLRQLLSRPVAVPSQVL